MKIEGLLEEIKATKHAIDLANSVLDMNERGGFTWVVAASNNTQYRATADQEFLIDAVKSQREVLANRLQKLQEAVAVVEKVIDGLVSDATSA